MCFSLGCALQAIYIYPIKSTCGIKLESAEIGPFGFKHDREWMLIEEGGGFLSQRALPTVRVPFPQLILPKLSSNLPLLFIAL